MSWSGALENGGLAPKGSPALGALENEVLVPEGRLVLGRGSRKKDFGARRAWQEAKYLEALLSQRLEFMIFVLITKKCQ